jgi:hypothetical protein
MMHIYTTEEDGPAMKLELPVAIVETLIEVSYRYISPNMGLDGAFTDELREQLAAWKRAADTV